MFDKTISCELVGNDFIIKNRNAFEVFALFITRKDSINKSLTINSSHKVANIEGNSMAIVKKPNRYSKRVAFYKNILDNNPKLVLVTVK